MVVSFCGHAEIFCENRIRDWLLLVCQSLMCKGANIFLLGGYGKFDKLAVNVLNELKLANPNIEIILVLPYLDFKYDPKRYTSSIYPPLENVPPRFAILKRNQWMVGESDILVSYVLHDWGGAAKTKAFAEQKHKHIINFDALE